MDVNRLGHPGGPPFLKNPTQQTSTQNSRGCQCCRTFNLVNARAPRLGRALTEGTMMRPWTDGSPVLPTYETAFPKTLCREPQCSSCLHSMTTVRKQPALHLKKITRSVCLPRHHAPGGKPPTLETIFKTSDVNFEKNLPARNHSQCCNTASLF